MGASEPVEAAKELTRRALWTNTAKHNTSKSLSASFLSPPDLGPDRISTPGHNKGHMSSWFWTDDEYRFLNSTPFTSNVPSFRHGPIRLSKVDLVNADTIDVLDWKLISSPDETLDWTAYHVAILGGAGEFFSDPSGSCTDDDEEELIDGLCDWLRDLGYSSHSLGALVFEGAFVRNHIEKTDESPPIPVNEWTDVYRALSHQQRQDSFHVMSKAQESEGASDIMSMMSYAESIFDAAATMSTASSAPGGAQELVSKFVDMLVRDSSVARMVSMALSDDGMGPERFRRNFGRILRSYSRELRRSLDKGSLEGYDASCAHAAAFVSRKAPHASHLIVSRFSQARKSMPPRDGLADSDRDSSSGSKESEGESEVLNIERLESFFTKGEPFGLLRWRLRALVYPDSFLSRVRDSTEKLFRIASGCGLTGLLSKAQQQQAQTPESLRAEFTEQVECLARDLRVQCSTSGQIRVAEFLRVHSQYVAARLIESTTPGKESDSKTTSFSDEILEDIVANTPPDVWEMDFRAHWDFITSTKAFQDFLNDLRDMAYPTLFSRARKLIAKSDEPGSSSRNRTSPKPDVYYQF